MKRGWIFVAATIAISWAAAGVFALVGGEWNTLGATLFAVGYMFVPALVAVVMARAEEGGLRETLGLHFSLNRWWLVAWLAPAAITVLAIGVALLFPGVELGSGIDAVMERFGDTLDTAESELTREALEGLPVPLFWVVLVQGLVAGATINAVVAFGEEAGWRGYLYDKWRHLGFWRYSLLVGAVWGVWHAPLIAQGHNYPNHPIAGIGMMAVFCVLYSPLFTLVRDRSGSTFGAAILHGSINGLAGLAILTLVGGGELLVGVTGLAGFIVLAVVNVAIVVWLRGGAER